jgi:hypothetical protein
MEKETMGNIAKKKQRQMQVRHRRSSHGVQDGTEDGVRT